MPRQFIIDAVDELNNLKSEKDFEKAHLYADAVLCNVLRQLGYESLVDHYVAIRKEYT